MEVASDDSHYVFDFDFDYCNGCGMYDDEYPTGYKPWSQTTKRS